MVLDRDDAFRAAAITFVNDLVDRSGGFVRREELESFTFEGVRTPLLAYQRGIWKPRGFTVAVSILTSLKSPYDDAVGPDGFPRYKWRGTDPNFYDNASLRRAMNERKPLIWFIQVSPRVFDALCPVWLVHEEPDSQQFVVAVDDLTRDEWHQDLTNASMFDPIRRYADRVVKERLHQRVFRDRVLLAYDSQCSLCRLRHRPLLDAAHIKADREGGLPVVPNGLAMCAIHHRAFDAFVLTVLDDYQVELRPDVLVERDGPTLLHALQGLHGQAISLPRRKSEWPRKDLLEERYERFRAAG